MNGFSLAILKGIAYFVPLLIAGTIGWFSIVTNLAVLQESIDNVKERITRIERIFDRQ